MRTVKRLVGAAFAVSTLAIPLATRPALATPVTPAPFGFQPLSPFRLVDTRDSPGRAPVGQGGTISIPVLGRAGIPTSGVESVALNVSVTEPTAAGFVTVWPSSTPQPLASTVNFAPGQTVPNAAIVGVGPDGAIAVFNNAGNAHVIVDVTGWFPTGSGLTAVAPTRLLDTRTSVGRVPVGQNASIDVTVTGTAGVPASGVVAVALNVAVTEPTAAGFLTVWPAGETRPLASNGNFTPGVTVANSVVAKVGTGGAVSLYNSGGSSHLVVDITGYFKQDAGFVPLTPVRIDDTRFPDIYYPRFPHPLLGDRPQRFSAERDQLSAGIPPLAKSAAAVVLNVTVVAPTTAGYLTVWPHGQPRPLASSLNFVAGQTVANTVIVGVDADASFDIVLNAGRADVIVDVVGTFPLDGLGLLDLWPHFRSYALGTDVIAVVFCEDPGAPGNHTLALDTLRNKIAPYYQWLSEGEYAMEFTDVGSITATSTQDCLAKADAVAVPAGTESMLAVYVYGASAFSGAGFAGPGTNDDTARTFPENSRSGYVTYSSLVQIGSPNAFVSVAAHEFGHMLDFPHSYVSGSGGPYTNPMDVMSRSPLSSTPTNRNQPQGTIAINRFRAGWLSPRQVAVHRSAAAAYTIDPIGGGGTQMVVVPGGGRNLFTTLETRVKAGNDIGIDKEGVVVHVVDGTCDLGICFGVGERIAPATGGPNSIAHVLDVGQSLILGGLTVTVTGRTGNSFTVSVTGTTYVFPDLYN